MVLNNKKIKYISLGLLLFTHISWSQSQGLNGILTFDEYDNFDKGRTGITSFELIDGKASRGYKEATGSFPYHHKNGNIVFRQGCGLSVIDKDGFTTSIVPCPPKKGYRQRHYQHPQLSEDGLFVAVELLKYVSNKSYGVDTHNSVFIFDINGNKIAEHDAFFSPTWLPDGRLLLSSSRDRYGLFLTDKSLKNTSQIDNNKLQAFAYYPDVSPDGKRVVFEYNQQIWIMNINATGLKRLLRGAKRLRYPTWSPDGKYIAYLRTDSSDYYDGSISLFEVDGEHQQSIVDTKEIFSAGKTGYPDIAGALSWVSSDFSTEKVSKDTKMLDISKVGYGQKSFNALMELLAFTLGRELSEAEKIAWVKSDYKYARGDFKKRQKNMKKVLEKFSSMNDEIKKVKDKKYVKLLQKYMQEYFMMSYAKAPIATSNGMVSKLLKSEPLLPINIKEKESSVIPVKYNKDLLVRKPIGIESANVKKLKESRWVKAFYKEHQSKKLNAVKKMETLFKLDSNRKSVGLIESWSKVKSKIDYYREDKIPSFDNASPIYLLDTSDIVRGYKYLLNSLITHNVGFDLNKETPSDFQREMMSHIKRMRFQIDGDETPTLNFDLWFDDEDYASTFLTLIKLKKIDLKANYEHKTIDEWLLEKLLFKQDGKHIKIEQTFSSELTKEFITLLCDEIELFQK